LSDLLAEGKNVRGALVRSVHDLPSLRCFGPSVGMVSSVQPGWLGSIFADEIRVAHRVNRCSFRPVATSPNAELETSYPKHKIKVLLLEGIHESARRLFADDGVDVQLLSGALEEQELAEHIQDVHLLGIRS